VNVLAQIQEAQSGLENAWDNILEFLPKIGAFLLILIIGYFIARILAGILDKVLRRVGFNRWVERGGVKTALDQSQYDAAKILSRIVFWVGFLFVLQLAFGVFGPNPISTLLAGLIAFLPKLFVALVIIVITAAVASFVRDVIRAALGGLTWGRFVAAAAMIGIWFIGASMALNQVEVAPEIVNGLFYAVLALIVGIAIVAIGGGGIQPLRQRWERALRRAEEEAPRARQARMRGSQAAQPGQTVGRREPVSTSEIPPTQPGPTTRR
jgi:MFS family permease